MKELKKLTDKAYIKVQTNINKLLKVNIFSSNNNNNKFRTTEFVVLEDVK